MKKFINGVIRHNRICFVLHQLNHIRLITAIGFFTIAFTSGCKKESETKNVEEMQMPMAKNSQADVLNAYGDLSKPILWELQQARAATAKYRNIENAIKDGYTDIAVDVDIRILLLM
jgi:hypothetical protein